MLLTISLRYALTTARLETAPAQRQSFIPALESDPIADLQSSLQH